MRIIYSLIFCFLFFVGFVQSQARLDYPQTKHVNQFDNYFGVKVADPYRWLEDDNAEEVKQWAAEQNKVTFGYLNSIPFRDKIKERYSQIINYERYSAPFKAGKNYFYFKNDGLQNQDVLYIQEKVDGKADVFLDPNKFSEDGTVSLTNLSTSHDGKYLSYGTASGGSDWNEIFVMNVPDRKKLSDHLKWIKFSGMSWAGDGFYYSRYPQPAEGEELTTKNVFHKVYYHKVGTQQDDDKLIFEDKTNSNRFFGAQTTEDESYLIIYFSEGTSKNGFYAKNLKRKDSEFVPIIENLEDDYSVVDNEGEKLLVLTNRRAPNFKLVLIDPLQPLEENWKEILPESKNVLQHVNIIGEKLIAVYMQDASNHVYVYDINGKLESKIELPALGRVSGFSGKKDEDTAFYTFTSFTYPPTTFKFDVKTMTSQVFRKAKVDFNFDDYVTKQVFYKSKDGTKVPMFIVHKKGLELNGQNPAFLYAYGGFNASLTPTFSTSRLILLENGGVYAVANLRGGGEYGEEWHQAGMLFKKQNVFDDFISAAEYLIENKYTSPEKLAVSGASNGGLLIGAVMNQRPDLMKVALPAVGVMDMLRYHKFTIGWAWAVEYGSSEDSLQFYNLFAYSPLHNIKEEVNYPATLVTTADHDDRVVPAHSFKYIATLQEKYKGDNPVLIRIETKAGHGAGKPTSKIIEEQSDIWSFVFYNLGVIPKY